MKVADKEMIQQAKEIATAAHVGQFRMFGDDEGKPYIIHPERVAKRLEGSLPIVQAAAWLHDVLEDTDITAKGLKVIGVDPRVIKIVEVVTRGKDESYWEYIQRVKHENLAVQVKIADLEDNMMSLPDGSLKLRYQKALAELRGCP